MFKKLFGIGALSALSYASNSDSVLNGGTEFVGDTTDDVQEAAAEMQCSIYAGASLWNIRGLEVEHSKAYEYTDSSGNVYEWNYCTYLHDQVDHVQSYATKTSSRGTETALATQYISDDDKQFVLTAGEDSDTVTGLQFTQYSSSVCIEGRAATNTTAETEDVPYSFTTKLMCDESVTG